MSLGLLGIAGAVPWHMLEGGPALPAYVKVWPQVLGVCNQCVHRALQVIEAAGLNKRKYPDQSEAQILLRALRDVNVPKFGT
eukprot:6063904-Amphidinium_carterae.1